MEKYLSKQEVKVILENAPKGSDQSKLVEGLVNRGYTLEGLNDNQPKPAETATQEPAKVSPVNGLPSSNGDLGIGIAKGIVNTVQNVAKPITNLLPDQKNVLTGETLPKGFTPQELTPTNTTQKIGKGIEQVAEYAIPETAGLKVAKGAGIVNSVARSGMEALGNGAVSLAQTGNTSDAINAGLVSSAFPVGGKVLDAVKSEKNAGRIINSLIKTKLNDLSFGKNPGKTVAELGITGNSLEDFAKNISTKVKEVGSNISNILSTATQEGKTTNLTNAFSPIDEALANARKAELSNAPLISKLEALQKDLSMVKTVSKDEAGKEVVSYIPKDLSNLTPEEAFSIKKNVSELTKFTGNPSDDKIANAALIKVYSNIKNSINEAVGGKELPKLNDQYANLITANKAVNKRMDTLEGQNIISLGAKSAGTATAVLSLLTGTAPVTAVLAGLSVAGGEKALSSPAVKTRVSKWLASKSNEDKKAIFKAAPYLKGLIITKAVQN